MAHIIIIITWRYMMRVLRTNKETRALRLYEGKSLRVGATLYTVKWNILNLVLLIEEMW